MDGNNYPQTKQAIETHSFSNARLENYPKLVHALLLVKKAAANANGRVGGIPLQKAKNISAACDTLLRLEPDNRYSVDVFQGGGSIGIHMNILEAILAEIELPNISLKEVNASQSTADVCATAARIALIECHRNLDSSLTQTKELLQLKTEEFASVPMTALTCMQDALPTTLDTLFQSYHDLIQRRQKALTQSIQQLYQVNLGGTVIGSGDGASPAYRAFILEELNALVPTPFQKRKNGYDAAQNIDDLVDVSSQLTLLAQSFIKIGKDLRLLSSGPSTGFKLLIIPSVIKGSSFFKNKNNPTIIETLLNAAFLVLGKNRTVQATMEHPELHLNIFEMTAVINIYESIELLAKAISNFNNHFLKSLKSIT